MTVREISKSSKREKAKRDEHIVKHGHNRRQPKMALSNTRRTKADKTSLREKRLANPSHHP